MLRRKRTRTDSFIKSGIQWASIHIARDAPSRRGALFYASTAAGRENNNRSAGGVIDREGKKKFPFDVDLLLHQDRFDWKLSHFHRQHARRVAANISRFFGESHPANTRAPLVQA